MGIIDSSAHPTLVHVLRQRATEHPDKVAFEYLGQRSETNASDRELSYGSLDGKARAIAARLVEAGGQNEPVMLLFRPGLDFISAFLGCLYARAFAVPAYPPAGGSGRGLVRLQAVLSDCGARIVLTDGEAFSQESAPELGSPLWIRTDDLPATAVDSLPDPEADDLAFLQYTSGATGSPRGVMVSHGNLMHNLAAIRQAFAGDPEKDRGVFWLPQYHDMGLIGGLLLTCWAGSRSTIFSPLAFVKRPLLWLQTITRTRATISGGPNFAYDLCLETITDSALQELDLSSWRVAFSGSEPVHARTCLRFAERFERCGFRAEAIQPGYGMVETTLMVSARRPQSPLHSLALDASALETGRAELTEPDRERVRRVVSCGGAHSRAGRAHRRSSDARGAPRPHGWRDLGARCKHRSRLLAAPRGNGSNVWRSSRRRRRAFLAHRRSGFVREGELFVTGRLKELLIFCGKNHYPLDIERTVSTRIVTFLRAPPSVPRMILKRDSSSCASRATA